MEWFVFGIVIAIVIVGSVGFAKQIDPTLEIPIKTDPLLPKHLIIIGPDAFGRYAWKNLKTGSSGCYNLRYEELVQLLLQEKS